MMALKREIQTRFVCVSILLGNASFLGSQAEKKPQETLPD